MGRSGLLTTWGTTRSVKMHPRHIPRGVQKLDKQIYVGHIRGSQHSMHHMLAAAQRHTPYKSRTMLLYSWVSNATPRVVCARLLNSMYLRFECTHPTHVRIQRLQQIQTAWFDYRRTTMIKLHLCSLRRVRALQLSWFQHKRGCRRPITRLLQWVSTRRVSTTN